MGAMKVWDGTTWQTVAPFSERASCFVGPDAPAGATYAGDLWWDTDDPAPPMPGQELAYNQITTNATTTATSAAAATVAIEGTSRSYDGTPILVEFGTPLLYQPAVASSWVVVNLWDDVTDLGQFGQVGGGSANGVGAGAYFVRRIVPTVGVHNYRIKAWISTPGGGTGTIAAGGAYSPAFIRVTRV